MTELPKISIPVDISTIGADRSTTQVTASEAERRALATALGLVDILVLSAEINLRRGRDSMIYLDGRVRAEIVQTCVVSLKSVRQTIDEPVTLRFIQKGSRERPQPVEVHIAPTEDDPPERISGSTIDLGAIVVEHFLLAIDPYPRAPGAEPPDDPARDGADSRESPFSALATLVQKGANKP